MRQVVKIVILKMIAQSNNYEFKLRFIRNRYIVFFKLIAIIQKCIYKIGLVIFDLNRWIRWF